MTPAIIVALAGLLAGAGGLIAGNAGAALLGALAAAGSAWAVLRPDRRSGGIRRPEASHTYGAVEIDRDLALLERDLGRLEDERELQRGVFEVSSELVGCVEEADARRRFAATLRRYWDCSEADLLVWERGTWRSLGGPASGPMPVLDQPVQLPQGESRTGGIADSVGSEGELVLDLSPAVNGRAAMVLRRARLQPSLSGLRKEEQQAVAETLRAQLALSLRRVVLYGRMQALARVDPLTGCHRRWYGETRLKELVDGGEVVAVAMVDIDHFKDVNDAHGHAVGDQVLAAVGGALIDTLRANDLVCRWGGEEFLAILPNTMPAGAALVAGRLRAAVGALAGLPVSVSISIGLACCAQDDTHHDLIAHADEALGIAKRGGRDQVVVAETAPGTQTRITSRHAKARSERDAPPRAP